MCVQRDISQSLHGLASSVKRAGPRRTGARDGAGAGAGPGAGAGDGAGRRRERGTRAGQSGGCVSAWRAGREASGVTVQSGGPSESSHGPRQTGGGCDGDDGENTRHRVRCSGDRRQQGALRRLEEQLVAPGRRLLRF